METKIKGDNTIRDVVIIFLINGEGGGGGGRSVIRSGIG